MSKFPWIQFFTGDWLKDPKLSMCTPATRGIWIDVISAAHELRCGTLTGTPEQLARICRCTVPDLCLALADLSATGAADIRERDGNISITCRRLTRDLKTREAEREKKRKQRSKTQELDNVPDGSTTDNYLINNEKTSSPGSCPENVPENVPEMSLLISDSNIYEFNILEKEKGCGEKEKPIDPRFKKIWEAFSYRRGSKKLAEEKFKKLNPSDELLETMLSWLEKANQSQQWQDKNYIPHVTTWLNQRQWEGDPPPMATASPQARSPGKQKPLSWTKRKLAEIAAEEAAENAQIFQKPENQPEEWVKALKSIRETVGDKCFLTWIDPVACHGIRDGTLELTVPTESFKTCLLENYTPILLKATGAKEISVRQWRETG